VEECHLEVSVNSCAVLYGENPNKALHESAQLNWDEEFQIFIRTLTYLCRDIPFPRALIIARDTCEESIILWRHADAAKDCIECGGSLLEAINSRSELQSSLSHPFLLTLFKASEKAYKLDRELEKLKLPLDSKERKSIVHLNQMLMNIAH